MKKLVLFLLVALMALTSCANNGANNSAKSYKVGSYSVTPAATVGENRNGLQQAQVNTTIATVVLDADGKIVTVNIDTAQNAVVYENDAVVIPAETPTKKEKKDAYNMKGASGIGKEWYEQIEALETYLVGKTLDEVKGLELDADGVVTDADLKASVTVDVDGYLEAVTKAMENAVEVKGEVAKVGATSFTVIQDQPADGGGRVTFNTNYGHVVLDADGKVLQSFVDVAQNRVNYKDGAFEQNAVTESKKVLKEGYNMKGVSGIGKEWFEQAQALENYFVGKTIDEINGIATNDDSVPTVEDLTSSVTIKIKDYREIMTRAAAAAIELK